MRSGGRSDGRPPFSEVVLLHFQPQGVTRESAVMLFLVCASGQEGVWKVVEKNLYAGKFVKYFRNLPLP